LDGKTALPNGTSQWITSPEARADGHVWRARAGAILTGIGTVLQDNPRLNVRMEHACRQPPLVIVDSTLQTPLDAALFMENRPIYIYAAQQIDARQQALEARGATVIYLPDTHVDGTGTTRVNLLAMLQDLARREVNELHVEAGQRLNGAFIREGLVDELVLYLAPKLMGQGRDMASFGPLKDLGHAMQLDFVSTQLVGPDLRLLARVRGRDVF
jgi:diaminohydroxyphosphoribosylaminopyrimidine deaminase/5-amino-6-(5-phosphoribosylamino)uracil reductase